MKPSSSNFDNNSFESSNNSFGVPDGFIAMDTNNKKKSDMNYASKSSKTGFENSEMFNENDFASIKKDDSGFMTSEMNILQQELGADFFFGSGENISGDSLLANAQDEDLPSYGVEDDSAEMQVSYDNLQNNGEPEMEMMRFDSSSLDEENDEAIPMMKYDSDVFNLDELQEE